MRLSVWEVNPTAEDTEYTEEAQRHSTLCVIFVFFGVFGGECSVPYIQL